MCSEVAVDGAGDVVTENALGSFGRTMEAGQFASLDYRIAHAIEFEADGQHNYQYFSAKSLYLAQDVLLDNQCSYQHIHRQLFMQ